MKKLFIFLVCLIVTALVIEIIQIKKINYQKPSEITIYKEVSIFKETCDGFKTYEPIVLSNSLEIEQFMKHINGLAYHETSHYKRELCGFNYRIILKDQEVIGVLDETHFITKEKEIVKLLNGDWHFLDDFEFKEVK